MHPTKALGPDGTPVLFYKHFWEVVGEDVSRIVVDILNGATDPIGINQTFIALVTKIKNPNQDGDFRPINLCNVVFKIVTKTIANRLKKNAWDRGGESKCFYASCAYY